MSQAIHLIRLSLGFLEKSDCLVALARVEFAGSCRAVSRFGRYVGSLSTVLMIPVDGVC